MDRPAARIGNKGKGNMQSTSNAASGDDSSADITQLEMLKLAAWDGDSTYTCPLCDHKQTARADLPRQHDAFVKHLKGCIKASQSAFESHHSQSNRDTGRRGGRQMKSIARFDPGVKATSWSSGYAASSSSSFTSTSTASASSASFSYEPAPGKRKDVSADYVQPSCPTPGCTGRANTNRKYKTHSSAEYCPIAKGMLDADAVGGVKRPAFSTEGGAFSAGTGRSHKRRHKSASDQSSGRHGSGSSIGVTVVTLDGRSMLPIEQPCPVYGCDGSGNKSHLYTKHTGLTTCPIMVKPDVVELYHGVNMVSLHFVCPVPGCQGEGYVRPLDPFDKRPPEANQKNRRHTASATCPLLRAQAANMVGKVAGKVSTGVVAARPKLMTQAFGNFGAKVPDWAICPISREIMVDPVATRYGHSYEKEDLINYIEDHELDPTENAPLTRSDMFPNRQLREAIMIWQKTYQNAV